METGLVCITMSNLLTSYFTSLLLARLVFYMEMVRFGNIKGVKPRLGSIMADPA